MNKTMAAIILFLWLNCVVVSNKLVAAQYGAFVDERQCGALYSDQADSGTLFVLKDFDQSVNLVKDYRSSVTGWQTTLNITVEENCTMTVCTGTYFQGTCYSLPSGSHQNPEITTVVNSANCTCERECNCDDVEIPMSYMSCGRAYMQNNCLECNSAYLPLLDKGSHWNVPSEYAQYMERIILRTGCNLTVWTERSKEGDRTEISGNMSSIVGNVGSYECTCDDAAFEPPERPSSYHELINLLATKAKLYEFLLSNISAAEHPGIKAALDSTGGSWGNGRSTKNSYILLIGTNDPELIGLYGCSAVEEQIGECYFPVQLDSLGVLNAELRVIYLDFAPRFGDKGVEEDSRRAATLIEYLSNHEDLKNNIPNAVILLHSPMNDGTIVDDGSKFHRKLGVLEALKPLIMDTNYSNLIIFLDGLSDLVTTERRNPEETLAIFENVIRSKNSFPEPILIVPTSRMGMVVPMVNGYYMMNNGEYTRRNFHESLKLVSSKGIDPLGNEIFSAVYPWERQQKGVMDKTVDILADDHTQVILYRGSTSTYIDNLVNIKRKLMDQMQDLIAEIKTRVNAAAMETTPQAPQEFVSTTAVSVQEEYVFVTTEVPNVEVHINLQDQSHNQNPYQGRSSGSLIRTSAAVKIILLMPALLAIYSVMPLNIF